MSKKRNQDDLKATGTAKLTDTLVKAIEPPESGYKIKWDTELQGFGLRTTQAGAKSFIVQAKIDGRTRRTTIGKFGTKTTAQARKMAKGELGKMASGTDPVTVRKHKQAISITLAEIAEDYKTSRRTSKGLPLKASTKSDIDKHLKGTFSDWQNKPVATIDREMVSRRYSERCKSSIAQANQAFRVLRALLNYAAAKHRTPDGQRIITDNPVEVLRDASMLRSVKARSSMVPQAQIGQWWSAVQTMRTDPALTTASRSAADLIALLALTGLRIGEARALKREQIDLDGAALTLMDTKNRTDVTLPLSDAALSILKARPNGSAWIFPARSGNGHLIDCRGQLQKIAEQTGIEVTAHDLRRTFRAVAAASNVELWRTKALMNHKQNQDVTLANYTDLSDVRNLKPEADRIAQFYEDQRRVFESDNVVRLERRA